MDNRLFRLKEVCRLTGLAKSTVYLQMQQGDFPRPVKIGERSVAWRGSDLEKWINDRPSV
ncbi:MAG: AlpA family transcriptional regulator [Pseudomonadota bacterium]|nr:AlpA family transcriptional regulator [Pseudomonadota bacterium]